MVQSLSDIYWTSLLLILIKSLSPYNYLLFFSPGLLPPHTLKSPRIHLRTLEMSVWSDHWTNAEEKSKVELSWRLLAKKVFMRVLEQPWVVSMQHCSSCHINGWHNKRVWKGPPWIQAYAGLSNPMGDINNQHCVCPKASPLKGLYWQTWQLVR